MKIIIAGVLIFSVALVGMAIVTLCTSTPEAPPPLVLQTPSVPPATPTPTPTPAEQTDHPIDTPISPAADTTPPAVTIDPPPQPAVMPVNPVPAVQPRKGNADPALAPAMPRRRGVVVAEVGQPIIAESDARLALNSVGMDPDAEAVWVTAINDPNLPDNARKNLIEDLNENGISDPDHPTAGDLPLIKSRLALIEQIAPDAMDDVNLAAFNEAYKDLAQMEKNLTAR